MCQLVAFDDLWPATEVRNDFAFEVHPVEIRVAELRRMHAVTDIDDLAANSVLRTYSVRVHQELFTIAQLHVTLVAMNGHLRTLGVDNVALQLDLLIPAF